MKKVGLVLSGGGIRGIAHLGLLQALDELQLKPHAISGTSAGAIIGALYAEGISPQKILELGKANLSFGFTSIALRSGGLFSIDNIHKALLENLPHDSFEGLKIPLYVNATDLYANKTTYFSKGKLVACLEASASVPLIFSPADVENKKYVDGGLLNNFPVEPLLAICDKIVGCHVNPLQEYDEAQAKLSRFALMERCYHMSIASTVYSKTELCDLFIEPPLSTFGMFDTKKSDQIFTLGYEAAINKKEKLLSLWN